MNGREYGLIAETSMAAGSFGEVTSALTDLVQICI